MKCLRLVITVFFIVVGLLLSGFKKPINHSDAPLKNKHSAVNNIHQQKPLDLTVPLREVSFAKSPETITTEEDSALDSLADAKKAKAVELQGHLIMSQEPEAGKIKSADGAGILINLRH